MTLRAMSEVPDRINSYIRLHTCYKCLSSNDFGLFHVEVAAVAPCGSLDVETPMHRDMAKFLAVLQMFARLPGVTY